MKQKTSVIAFEYNVYDLNMAKTLKEDLPFVLSTELVTNQRFKVEHFQSTVWKSIEMYCRDLGADYDYLLKAPPSVPIIIDSSHHMYFQFLEIALMFYDPFLIKHFLTYQYNNFKGNLDAKSKEDFLAKVLFLGYTNVKLNGPNNNLHRKEKIFDWLEAYNAENLPERYSKQQAVIKDDRYKGKLTQAEVREYWMHLCNYKKGETIVEVLNELDVTQFLHANFFGFNSQRAITKLTLANINQKEFTKFCREFFKQHTPNNPTAPFLQILKNNFSIYDSTSLKSMKDNFSR